VGPRAGLDGRKILSLPGFDARTVQPVVVSRYTDRATRPTNEVPSQIHFRPQVKDIFHCADLSHCHRRLVQFSGHFTRRILAISGLGWGGGGSVEGNGRKIPPTPKLRLSVYRLSHNYQFRKGINMVVVRTALERNRYEIRESGWKLTPLSKIWLSLRECSRNTRVLGRP